jgi:parallel beta-helix repeat protein
MECGYHIWGKVKDMKLGEKMIISKKTALIGLISIVGLVVASLSITFIVIETKKNKLVEHDPIIIWGDTDFTLYNFPGKGTSKNPYLIENYNITTNAKIGIYIWNTTKHFVVRNCLVDAIETGIYLDSIAHGTAKITNNECITNKKHGILLYDSHYQSLIQNTCTNNQFGIYIHSSSAIDLSENICTNNDYGLVNLYSPVTSLLDNLCTNNYVGAYFYLSSSPSFSQNKFTNNNYGVYLMSSSIAAFSDNEFSNNNYGIYLNSSVYSIFSDNEFSNNYYGIFMVSASDSSLANNILTNNHFGIYLFFNTNSCNMTYNLFQDNIGYAIYIEAFNSDSRIHHNSFIDNGHSSTSQAYDDSINFWYDPIIYEGNYWNDHDMIGSYLIDGSTSRVDLFPLENRPV